jgi:2-iminobutanoate/2-iminopropanoate deaminase
MSKTVIHTEKAPGAVGPYSQAIIANGMVFTAGQVPLVPGTKSLVEGGIQEQTRQVLQNVKAVLEAAGTNLGNVVKTTVFLSDMNNFAAMNEVYSTFFPENPPARSAMQVARLPLDALVEIETIAVL